MLKFLTLPGCFRQMAFVLSLVLTGLAGEPAGAQQMTAFKQAVAGAAAQDEDIAAFFRSRDYKPFWTAANAQAKRQALIAALSSAADHGLPASRYDVPDLIEQMKAADTSRARGEIEVTLSRIFLQYARDVQTGMLTPSRVDGGIVREVPYRDRQAYLGDLAKSAPHAFFRALPPQSNEYARLLKEKKRIEELLGTGGWGARVPATTLEPGDKGNGVVALRNRLIAMGFLPRSATQTYDAQLQAAVQRFQQAHGLEDDGVAGAGTIEQLNIDPAERLKSVLVALERERWLNMERGKRHILVNLTDFSAKIIDDDVVTFETRSVIGAVNSDKRTPEFSDMMEYMEINPDWTVPRGIIRRDYLPALQRNPNALAHLQVVDSRGRIVPRGQVNFARYTARTFPFNLRQPPSRNNALGTVKFMFPNKYAIYLHDTPDKNLFLRETRAYSSGCVRLHQPYDFAYALLKRQEADPVTFFQSILKSGRQTRVNLDQPVPVHLIYRTAFTRAKDHMQYRRDVYGRDARIWAALSQAGVALRADQS